MSNKYLAVRVKGLAGPIIVFRDYFMTTVLPEFGDIHTRAAQLSEEAYGNVMSQPASEDGDIDPASVAEAAEDYSYRWWTMMTSLRQSMLNLAAAGLYHLFEQQLAAFTTDGLFEDAAKNTQLSVVNEWYLKNLTIKFESLPSWGKVDELRMVANTVKHADGSSAKALRERRPDFFANPEDNVIYEFEGITLNERIENVRTVTPLSGEDFFITKEALAEYANCTITFFHEIAGVFEDRDRAAKEVFSGF